MNTLAPRWVSNIFANFGSKLHLVAEIKYSVLPLFFRVTIHKILLFLSDDMVINKFDKSIYIHKKETFCYVAEVSLIGDDMYLFIHYHLS